MSTDIDHIPQGILKPTTYKEAENYAVELGAVATRAMLTRDSKLYATYFFNSQDQEVLGYSHLLNCISVFNAPRVVAAKIKACLTPLTPIKYFGYKLLHQRKDGSLGSLFINRKQRLEPGIEYLAEDFPTKGYKHRPGWHVLCHPYAPHLKQDPPKVWAKVSYRDYVVHQRPENQGGKWILAKFMSIEEILE
jgi:hypothetical protein